MRGRRWPTPVLPKRKPTKAEQQRLALPKPVPPPPEPVLTDGTPTLLRILLTDSGWMPATPPIEGMSRWTRSLLFGRRGLTHANVDAHLAAIRTWAMQGAPGPLRQGMATGGWVLGDDTTLLVLECMAHPLPAELPVLVTDSGWINTSDEVRSRRGWNEWRRDLVFAAPVASEHVPLLEAWLRGFGCPGYHGHQLRGGPVRFSAETARDSSD